MHFSIFNLSKAVTDGASRDSRDTRVRSHALLIRPTLCNIQHGYAILRSMPLAYLE